jgi:hypothetical protein
VRMNLPQLVAPAQPALRPRLLHAAMGLALAVAGSGCALSVEEEVLIDDRSAFSASKDAPCFTTTEGGEGAEILPVDLDAERLGSSIGTIASHDVSSLGLIDGALLSCTHDRGLEIIDLASDKREQMSRSCDGIASDGTLIWVNSVPEQGLFEYQGLQALRDHKPSRTLPSAFASRLGLGEGRLLAAWHSAAEVLAVDLETGATTPIALPDYDGWIFGLAERGDRRYVVGGWVERGIRVYDRERGNLIDTLFADRFLQGLVCKP